MTSKYQLRCVKCDTTQMVAENDKRATYQIDDDSDHTAKSKAESLRGKNCPNCMGNMTAVKPINY